MLWTWTHRIAVDDELNNAGTTGRDRKTEKGSALTAIKPTHLEFLMPSPAALEFTFPLLMKMYIMSKLIVLAQLSLLKQLQPGRHS